MKIGEKVKIKFYKKPKTINEVIASLQSIGYKVQSREGFGQIGKK